MTEYRGPQWEVLQGRCPRQPGFFLDLKNLESWKQANIQRSIFLNVYNYRIGKNGSQVQEMIPWASQPSHESSKSWTYWTSGTNIHELREISTPANRCKVAGEAMGGKTLAALLSQKTGCYKATWRNFDQILLSFDEVIVLFMCCHSLPLFCVLVACARSASSAAKIHVNTCSKTLASVTRGALNPPRLRTSQETGKTALSAQCHVTCTLMVSLDSCIL